jgi:cbb3-type cytochrome oxidase maturation protein
VDGGDWHVGELADRRSERNAPAAHDVLTGLFTFVPGKRRATGNADLSILYLLIPLAVVLMAVAIGVFIWSIRSGQYEDLEGPAHRILMDDDDPMIPGNREKKPGSEATRQRGE